MPTCYSHKVPPLRHAGGFFAPTGAISLFLNHRTLGEKLTPVNSRKGKHTHTHTHTILTKNAPGYPMVKGLCICYSTACAVFWKSVDYLKSLFFRNYITLYVKSCQRVLCDICAMLVDMYILSVDSEVFN